MEENTNNSDQVDHTKKNMPFDAVGQLPTPADSVGHERTMSDNVGQGFNDEPDKTWLTTEELVNRLADKHDVKRDRRSAERYCQKGKVKAFMDDAQGIWFAEQSSVDILGAQLKEFQERKPVGNRSETIADPAPQQGSGTDASENHSSNQTGQAESHTNVHELRAKVVELEFEVKAKSEVINHLQSAREKDRDRFIELASETGEYKAEVKQLRGTLQITDGGIQESVTTSEYGESESDLSQSLPLSENDSISDATH